MSGIFKLLHLIKPVYDLTDKLVMLICKLLLIADIVITSMSVAGRYIEWIPDPAWSEQMVLTFMVYMAVLSATLAIRRKAHIRMTSFDKYLPEGSIRFMDLISDIAVLSLGGVMLYYGILVCQSPLARFGRYESIPTLSRFWMFLPIPIAGGSMIIFEIEQIFQRLEEIFTGGNR